jgi:hypothetical protein
MIDAINGPMHRTTPIQLSFVHVGTGPNHLECCRALSFLNCPSEFPGLLLCQKWPRRE